MPVLAADPDFAASASTAEGVAEYGNRGETEDPGDDLVIPDGTLAENAAFAAEGLWYVEALQLAQVHEVATGVGATIAFIDGPFNPDQAEFADADIVLDETNYCAEWDPDSFDHDQPMITNDSIRALHATNIGLLMVGNGVGPTGIPGVQGVAPGLRLLYYGTAFGCGGGIAMAVDRAVADGADVIAFMRADDPTMPMSPRSYEEMSGADHYAWLEANARAQAAGVILVAGSTNLEGPVPESGITFVGFPGVMNGTVTVESTTPGGRVGQPQVVSNDLAVVAPGNRLLGYRANYGDSRTFWRQSFIHGNSFASPITAASIGLAISAWPEATPNQILQLLAITATPITGEAGVRTDDTGFGLVNPYAMVTTSPMDLPDLNPFLRDDRRPSVDEIRDLAQTPSSLETTPEPETTDPTDSPVASSNPEPTDPTGTNLTGWILAALTLAAATSLAIWTIRKRRARE
ncbi:MAG: S8 family serine peptidase [Beutenbergiaceae bacterium]